MQGTIRARLVVLLCALAAAGGGLAMTATGAGAVVVQFGPHQLAGVTPMSSVNPAFMPGSVARPSAALPPSSNGNLDYHGGPVLHGSSPYVIFWDPNGYFTAADRSLYARYFADLAAASGTVGNVFSVDRQFTDSTGFADYSQTWSASHLIDDTDPYPAAGQCTENAGYGWTEDACLYDSQLQSEIAHVVNSNGLPTGLGGNAPIYFMVTPPDVNSCESDDYSCADNQFCAYHSSFTSGSNTVLYANIPTILAENDPKSCQYDGNSAVQSPNANPVIDVAIKYSSHEFNETTTDPLGNAWWDSSSGNEDGDNCNFYDPNSDPQQGNSAYAFAPTLGGSASAGTLYNQLINGDEYYTQSEWSNGNVGCALRATASAIGAAFSLPSTVAVGTSVSLNPSASSSAAGYSSTSWTFGDGQSSFAKGAPSTISHTFASGGTYQVTLTLVDTYGNLSTVTHSIDVHGTPTASFTGPSQVGVGTPAVFDGSGSSEPGGTIQSYAWQFGDGASASTETATHTYTTPGLYTVKLTATDAYGRTSPAATQQVDVVSVPQAAFTAGSFTAGAPGSFDASGSTDDGSSITGYAWSFGDGATATGSAPSHTYAAAGSYMVTLTVTDADGQTAMIQHPVVVAPAPATGGGSGGGAPASGGGAPASGGSTGSGTTTSSGGHPTGGSSATISAVKVRRGSGSERLLVSVTGAGTLSLGRQTVKAAGPGTVALQVKLSKKQRQTLRHHHRLTLRCRLTFVSASGSRSSRTVTIRLK